MQASLADAVQVLSLLSLSESCASAKPSCPGLEVRQWPDFLLGGLCFGDAFEGFSGGRLLGNTGGLREKLGGS